MTKTAMTEERAGMIALLLVKYTAARREMTLNPHEETPSDWASNILKKIGISAEKANEYLIRVVLTIATSKHFGGNVMVTVKVSNLKDKEIDSISLEIMREIGADLSPRHFEDRLKRMNKDTGVSVDDLKEFYISFIVPVAIAKIAGWKSCSIIQDSK